MSLCSGALDWHVWDPGSHCRCDGKNRRKRGEMGVVLQSQRFWTWVYQFIPVSFQSVPPSLLLLPILCLFPSLHTMPPAHFCSGNIYVIKLLIYGCICLLFVWSFYADPYTILCLFPYTDHPSNKFFSSSLLFFPNYTYVLGGGGIYLKVQCMQLRPTQICLKRF